MADKAISELIEAAQVTSTDLFVLQQNGTAKKLTGQTLINDLTKMLDGHGGIQSIQKTGTSGLTDTYRLTLADGTTQDIVVTNGRSISSITKTGTSGLKDTYTIKYNDGTSETFTVTNGRAINSVKQTSATGLTRTYTIQFNDGTSETFTVTDGRSVAKIEKTGTSGLKDTYTITYNDGTNGTFAVTNGAKGDKGDNVYLWIKYASQEPTESSHSFGDIPDNWIGIYSGPLPAAPIDWKQYAWFKIKGQQGDTGDAATLLSAAVEYQSSESGTIIPSGAWGTSVPVVTQGRYLWSRTTLTYNTGDPIVTYSVARMGLDGTGSVSSVANISPDPTGNIPLTAAHVGALPIEGGDMVGPINMNGQMLSGLNNPNGETEAATKGYVDNVAPKFTQATSLTNLVSGEKLTVSLGKIMKAIADLISHIGNKSNPHAVTASQISAGTLNSDRLATVPVAKGGTGATDAATARTNLDAAASSHNHAASNINSGTLNSSRLPIVPVTKGGTGANNAASAREKLGITPANIGAFATDSIITFYNVSLTVTDGVGTYTNSNIKASSRCFCQRRVGSFLSGIQMVAGTTSQNGYVTVAFDTKFNSNVNINLIVINS